MDMFLKSNDLFQFWKYLSLWIPYYHAFNFYSHLCMLRSQYQRLQTRCQDLQNGLKMFAHVDEEAARNQVLLESKQAELEAKSTAHDQVVRCIAWHLAVLYRGAVGAPLSFFLSRFFPSCLSCLFQCSYVTHIQAFFFASFLWHAASAYGSITS